MKGLTLSTAAAVFLQASVTYADISKIVRVDVKSQQFIDAQGRSRHFHGTNMVKKSFPWHADVDNFVAGYSVVDKDIQYLKDLNINVVRLGVHWAGVEPVRGVYNQTYLDITHRIIKKLQDNGIYTLVDHHQDVWAPQLCGHGAPLWFVKQDWVKASHRMPWPQKAPFKNLDTDGVPSDDECATIGGPDWALSYFNSAVGNAFGRLYNNNDNLGDTWAAYWKVLATEYGTLPGVMGYDLMNEPWVGDHMANPLLLIPGVADRVNMEALWNKGNTAIRAVDNTTIVMFEGATWDILAGFNNVPGGDGSKTAQSYHYYKPPQIGSVESTIKNRIKDANRLKTTGMLTEFELWGQSEKEVAASLEVTRQADKYLQSWAAWAYENVIDRENLAPRPLLALTYARTFAEATAGITKTVHFDDVTAKYWVSWIANTAIVAPGLIRISPKMYYPDGIRVISSPPDVVTYTMENDNVIRLHYTKEAVNWRTITTSVQPFYPTGPITNSASGGKCIDVSGGVVLPDTPTILYTCVPSWNQVWKFKDNTIQLAFDQDHQSGKYCLDTQTISPTEKFLNVVLNPCEKGKASQKWSTTSTGNIVNTASGNCIDITASRYKDGSRLVAYPCGNRQANQVWKLPNGVDGTWYANM
ncbi:hypothetical protein DRE_07297 [Drechslerella stenobrocha 248]|uniref:Ricin B lectin domain-containing protein n=1 Tax=Drechslerella stenobrocha 248 TaxID=1043628 RepID=W7HVC0_9PEZI|nr:hypothetical protein DRE_07297 [Drechslerella stenobrocha 248]